ncbi:MAG: ribonuclease R [Bacteroidales bacterium]|nr:ribonuclease R [Bacteroidales bacterium]MDD3664964.1 ribonuclease R [Bacteroidales bacterium]
MPKKTKDSLKRSGGTFVNNVLAVFGNSPLKALNYKQVAAAMGVKDKATRDMIYSVLFELKQQETIQEVKPGKFLLNPKHLPQLSSYKKFITGTVDMKQTGKAYVTSPDLGEDVYISPNNTGHALDGDKVKVYLFPKRSGRKTEGQVVEVIERNRNQFVGTLQLNRNYAFLLPDNTSMPVDIFIPPDKVGTARNGEKVVARITEWPEHSRNPFGEIVAVLGMPGNNNVEMQSILVEFDFPLAFRPEVEAEAGAIPETISKEEIARRRDFRDIFTITIDPADAKDFDDALSLQKLPSGNWEVGVHIADVAHYVQQGSPLDKEAFDRGTSIYLVDRVIPMLPEKLSNHVCSLRQDEEKLCFSAVFEMDNNAKILNQWFGKTVIKSNRRYAYEEVQAMIEGADGDFKEPIMTLFHLSSILRKERYRKGAINFESQEVKFRLDNEGKPIGVYIKEQKEANWLIEDFMLLANRKVAELIGVKKGKTEPKTFVYRIHDAPSPEKLNTFSQFVSKLGYSMKLGSNKEIASSFNKLLKDVSGKGEETMISSIAIRTMAKAVYSTHNIGHYGLAFTYYTHFTSPIRRYPDLLVHRLLFDYMNGATSANAEEYEKMCDHASEMERKAMEAERASVKYKQAEFLIDKLGQVFEARISGVSKWGIFAEIIGNKCEGMIRLRDLNDDFYYLDEDNYQVVGQRYGETIKLGDEVKIRVKNVDLQRKQIDFELIQDEASHLLSSPRLPKMTDFPKKPKGSGKKRH